MRSDDESASSDDGHDTGVEVADAGGDPACWAHRVCPACGLLNEAERPRTCEGCGAEFPFL